MALRGLHARQPAQRRVLRGVCSAAPCGSADLLCRTVWACTAGTGLTGNAAHERAQSPGRCAGHRGRSRLLRRGRSL